MKYFVYIDKEAAKSLSKMPKKIQRQIGKKIDALADDPFPANCQPIKSSSLKNVYRIKSGNYRIGYQVKRKKMFVLVIRIGHRKDFYLYFGR